MVRKAKVLIMAGGTGGHVFPALATAQYLMDRGVIVEWLGTKTGIEAELVSKAGIPISFIEIAGLRGKGVSSLLVAPFKLLKAMFQAISVVRKIAPDCVLGMGGFASGPGGFAAWILRVPLIIHEQNAIAGMTNKILARFARVVLQAFPGAFVGSKVKETGNPIRADIFNLPDPLTRSADRKELNILVVGGSLGAAAINEAIPEMLQQLEVNERPRVKHQVGKRNYDEAVALYEQLGVEAEVLPFIDDMAAAYGWADLVICRAGALTVSEVAAVGVSAIFIPFPFAVDDHQTKNAGFLVNNGAAILLPQSEVSGIRLAALVKGFVGERNSLIDMAQRAKSLAKPMATKLVAEECLEMCRV